MEKLTYSLPGFDGYSAIRNRRETQASDIQNFEMRDTSLRVRKGSTVQLPVTTAAPESFFLFKTKAGAKHFLGAEGANIWAANANMDGWVAPALKADCDNAVFDRTVFMNKIYMGNGTDRLVYDGTTLDTMVGTPPKFNIIETYRNRLWCNNLEEPTFLYRTEFDDNGVPLPLGTSYYLQIAENTGDGIKGLTRLLTHLLIINEFSTYALYGSSIEDFTKTAVGPVGAVNRRSIANINETIFWLAYDGIYRYSGSEIFPVSFNLGRLEDIINTSMLAKSCAIGYNNCYWLAIASKGSAANDIVLIYDILVNNWSLFKFPFSINDFCLDGNTLYCAASDKKIYKLDTGSKDGETDITATWVSDALDLGAPGKKKKVSYIAVEMGEIAAGGKLNLYLQENNGNYSAPFQFDIPTAEPGKTAVVKVKTNKFYNLTVKLETTATVTINKLTFGGKVKTKVK